MTVLIRSTMPVRVAGFALALTVIYLSVGPAFGQAGASNPRDLFDASEVLEVEVEVAESDWDLIRMEGRSLPHVLASCADPNFDSYTRVPAMVSIDGERTSDVAVRKKGFIGSLSTSRPSLRVDYGRDEHDGRTFQGVRRIALNNNNQDPTNAKQCVAYELFADAGIAAPRCSLAQVSVNGVDRGFFTSLETVNKPFLRRLFADDDGNLYESQLGDFTPELRGGYELKTNNSENDTSDLDRVLRVVELPDDQFVEAFSEVFDFDEFITFWAMEVLTGHWDGMTGNLNNHFIYHDPTDDRFHPIPWGTDGTFQPHVFRADNPQSVYVSNSLSSRLYAIPAAREIFHDRLRELLDQVWDEDQIVARFREIAEQTDGDAAALAAAESFVLARRPAILEELASNNGTGPEVTDDLALVDGSCNEPEPVSGLIDFTWNDDETAFQPVTAPEAVQVQIQLEEGPVQFIPGQVAQLATINAAGQAQLALAGMDSTTGGQLFVGLMMPEASYRVGEVPFIGGETLGIVLQLGPDGVGTPLGIIGGGTITLTEVGRQNGDPVRGHWEGYFGQLPEGFQMPEL